MDVDASLALHARGKEAWNAWAGSMIDRRRALVAAGQWAWARDSRADEYPTNEATGHWMRAAAAQFSYHEFCDAPDFSGFVFPGAGLFIAAKFPQGARFRAARFRDGACFNFARFGAAVAFDDSEFCSAGSFSRTDFLGAVRFDNCRFVRAEFEPSSDGRIDCSEAKFARPASFAGMRCRAAVFSDAEFAQAVSFEAASFSEMFFLYKTIFRGPVLSRGAQFPYEVDWSQATLAGPHSR
ncbi:pentapeptide repeat-containing protein [Methylocapsa sp. S129]|uniref:pentapeptide repeat-containing protein n=1 Tax=Methylocapsa sp. S129 TaxID=1641869 RepID=UPI00131BCFC6|nr:hypothetical protein [Methylocapsa sp. S129]